MDLSTLSALTWVALIAAAALTGLAKTAIPGLASVAAALFALVLPAKESTGIMLAQRRWGPPHVSQGRVARAAYGTLAGFTTMAANGLIPMQGGF